MGDTSDMHRGMPPDDNSSGLKVRFPFDVATGVGRDLVFFLRYDHPGAGEALDTRSLGSGSDGGRLPSGALGEPGLCLGGSIMEAL